MSMSVVIVQDRAEIIIVCLIVNRLSASPLSKRKGRRRRSAVPACHDLKRRRVISMK